MKGFQFQKEIEAFFGGEDVVKKLQVKASVSKKLEKKSFTWQLSSLAFQTKEEEIILESFNFCQSIEIPL